MDYKYLYVHVGTFIRAIEGCQMVHLHIKNTNFSILWRAFERKMSVYFTGKNGHLVFLRPFGQFLCQFGIFCAPFWYIVPRKTWQPWSQWRISVRDRIEEVDDIGTKTKQNQ
jgi:hypothetical protein